MVNATCGARPSPRCPHLGVPVTLTWKRRAARATLMGSSTSKAALQATTKEPREPKPKHLAYLIQYINETNMSVQHLADVLYKKTRSSNWVVVFKALVTVHHLMVHGNERFIQHLASRPSFFTLHSFLDISIIEAYTMSAFIRRYSRYLNEKSLAYRLMASDVTKSKRGRDGVIRAMSTEQLLNTLPVIQTQLDALLNFNANPDELTNGIIRAAFMLLFRDALRLFAAYNEGILNLLDKFFDMRKNECKESLGIYINFLEKTTKLTQFLRVAEQVGIDQSNIPNLIQPPRSLLEALKQHLASLEEKNISPPCRSDAKLCQPSKMEISGEMSRQLDTCTCASATWNSNFTPCILHMVPTVMGAQPMNSTQGDLKTSSPSAPFPEHQMQPM